MRREIRLPSNCGDATGDESDTAAKCEDDVLAPAAARTPEQIRATEARRKALELLSRREHSCKELILKLTSRGFDESEATDAVQYMLDRGWQSDARYAEMRARNRMLSGHGPLHIRAELRQHDISSADIEAALEACDADWQAAAAEILQRRFGTAKADTRKEIARRGAFLQRRGFDMDAIRHALAEDFD